MIGGAEDGLVSAVVLQTAHGTSPDRSVVARLPLRPGWGSIWSLGFHEEIGEHWSPRMICGYDHKDKFFHHSLVDILTPCPSK